jgi:hypothetical protein
MMVYLLEYFEHDYVEFELNLHIASCACMVMYILSCMHSTQVLTCMCCEEPGVYSCLGRAGGHGPYMTWWCHVIYEKITDDNKQHLLSLIIDRVLFR